MKRCDSQDCLDVISYNKDTTTNCGIRVTVCWVAINLRCQHYLAKVTFKLFFIFLYNTLF